MGELGKAMVLAGTMLIVVGLMFVLLGKITHFDKLPGDIIIKRENFTFYFPLTTCIFISIILSLMAMLWTRK